jgi:anaerobic magnesium-protoporphyrin IX monomethyl ester cyclase
MAKVLFVNPVIREEDDPRHVPYGIALLAAIVIEKGHLVQVFDANAWRAGDEVLDQVLEADTWDVIAVGGITTAYGYIKKIVAKSKIHAPQATIVAGGGFLTSMPHDVMKFLPDINVGAVGEAFETFPEILSMVDAGSKDWSSIPGVIYRDEKGNPLLTPERTLIEDLDSLPRPAWELFPVEEVYFKNSEVLFSEEGMTAKRRLDINASYGCSLICRYCFHLGLSGDMKYVENDDGEQEVSFDTPGSYTRTIRYHSPRYVVDLVKYAFDTYNIDFIGFLDENLMTMDKYSGRKWMKEICRLWIEEGLQPTCVRDNVPHDENCTGVHWSGTSHATLATQEVLHTMRRAGCSHLVYGYESFSVRVMKTIGKGATPKTNERSYHWTLDAGIRPIPNQIIGFPSEDYDSLRDNMLAWDRMGIVVKPFFATPYPGSEWYTTNKDRILKQYGGDLEAFLLDLGDATKITAVISEKFNAVELYGLRELMVNRDYKRIDAYELLSNASSEQSGSSAVAKDGEVADVA